MEGPDALFVYGSLMEPETRDPILGYTIRTIEARLLGFERRRSIYFYIAVRPDAEVAGLVLLGLTEDELRLLDEYEDVPHLYTRELIEVVTTPTEQVVECWVYLPTMELIQSRGRTET